MGTFCHKMLEWAQRSPEEKRRAGRVRCEMLQTNLGEVIDLSASGMRIRSKRRPKRENVALSIRTLDETVRVRAIIVRAEQVAKRCWELGVHFPDASPELQERLNEISRYAAVRRAVGPGNDVPRHLQAVISPAEEGCEGLRDHERRQRFSAGAGATPHAPQPADSKGETDAGHAPDCNTGSDPGGPTGSDPQRGDAGGSEDDQPHAGRRAA